MNYEETIDYLYKMAPLFQQVGTTGYKEGMENSFRIDEHLGRPHTHYKTIHVAGTNGKGSTAHLLASILQEAGYKTGLYTSPHLVDFRERIRINGEMISKEFVTEFIGKHKDFFEGLQPSFFELTTGLAFDWFADQQVDVALIETGLGGRLDCTNVITPLLSIITNISYDHTALLGDTLTAIAGEKGGIIKPGVPVVIGEAEGEVRDYFERRREEHDAKFLFAADLKNIQSSKLLPSGYWEFETKAYPELIDQLGGYAQEKNAETVVAALQLLRDGLLNIPPKAVYKGFRYVVQNTRLQGRWQRIRFNPTIVLDTGHNPGGMEYIVRQLKSERYKRLHIVFGMVADKDISQVLKLLPREADYYFTQAAIPRALPADRLAAEAAGYGLQGDVYLNVSDAFSAAEARASEKDFIFVGGSTFVVADALLFLRKDQL